MEITRISNQNFYFFSHLPKNELEKYVSYYGYFINQKDIVTSRVLVFLLF